MNKKDLTSRCTGIYFGEGPRWKENKLWFSDMQGDKVYTCLLYTSPSPRDG